jgi:putative endonuclease
VYFELLDSMEAAIAREKHIKGWQRAWKLRVIEETNPEWRDIWEEFDASDTGG